jgi:hypothetical protein
MNPSASASPAHEINRLHEEVVGQTNASQKCLHTALIAAWQAGKLLLAEQKRVRYKMGAAWGYWLEENFRGTHRAAQHYMRLAATVTDVAAFQGLSLRQVYLRLGIATEPKSRAESARVEKLPPHIRLANKLMVELSTCDKASRANPEQRAAFGRDLRALYERLRRFIEPGAPAHFTGSTLSSKTLS